MQRLNEWPHGRDVRHAHTVIQFTRELVCEVSAQPYWLHTSSVLFRSGDACSYVINKAVHWLHRPSRVNWMTVWAWHTSLPCGHSLSHRTGQFLMHAWKSFYGQWVWTHTLCNWCTSMCKSFYDCIVRSRCVEFDCTSTIIPDRRRKQASEIIPIGSSPSLSCGNIHLSRAITTLISVHCCQNKRMISCSTVRSSREGT